jgi:2-beta-glucuronyltransferase
MARHRPDVQFHLIGVKPDDGLPDNVNAYGEIAFARTIPFIVHADVGLAPYRLSPGMGYLGQSSLKLLQYAYCGLPILVPIAAAPLRSNVYAYDPQDVGSATSLLDRALEAGRGTRDTSIPDWSEVADQLIAAMDRAARESRRPRAA